MPYKIRTGTGVFSESTVGTQESIVVFSESFNAIPTVIVCWNDTNAIMNYMEKLQIKTAGTNAYQFTASAKRLKEGYAWYFNWVAIGY